MAQDAKVSSQWAVNENDEWSARALLVLAVSSDASCSSFFTTQPRELNVGQAIQINVCLNIYYSLTLVEWFVIMFFITVKRRTT